MKRLLTIPLLIAALAGPAALAQDEKQGNAPQEMPTFVESIDVRVVNVDVVVTDRKGNPITGLKKDDFEIIETGRLQNITNFYEVRERRTLTSDESATTPAAESQGESEKKETVPPEHFQRRIVFFIDNVSLAPFNRNRVFKAMKEFAKEAMRPGDQAMIATWNRSLKIRVPFTQDARQIEQELETISGESALGMSYVSERRSTEAQIKDAQGLGEAIALARSWAESVSHDVRQGAQAVSSLLDTLAGLEGKKILVLTTEGFQIQPGMEMFHYIDSVGRTNADWGGSRSILLEGYSYNATHVIQTIAKNANANDITLYTIHAGGLVGMTNSTAEYQQPVDSQVEQVALQNSTDSLRLLAEMTGGVATVGSNNFRAAFDRIERDLDNYYSLGYRAGTERVDRQRALEVRLRDPKLRKQYDVRSRNSFVEKSIGSEMADRVIANVFHASGSNDLGMFLTTGRPIEREDGTYLVSLETHLPIKNLTLLPEGESDTSRGKFSIWIVAADSEGDQSDVQTQSHTYTMKTADLADIGEKYYTYSIDLLLAKGRNRISVGALDELSHLRGFEQTEVLALDLR